jgi:selenocysteine lyase/cysteine desulfurase
MDALVSACSPDPGYLNTASLGVPPASTLERMTSLLEQWRRGRLSPPDFDDDIRRARTAFATLAGVQPMSVAIGATVSDLVGVIAASLPHGARVVIAEGEFTSLLFPFLAHADRGITVDELPLEELAGFTGPADLVAVSAVQSADGRVADLAGVVTAARAAGARTLIDTTQSSGWLPLDGSTFDYLVCGAYKWLLSPRGTAFLSVRPELVDGLRPIAASWYAGEDPWTSIYGSPLRLARDARRFDVSPAWFSWAGAAESLELLVGLEPAAVQAHDVGLANSMRAGLGLPPSDSAIVMVDLPDAADRLARAGVRSAVRAGRVRLSFHVYNDSRDVELAVAALTTDVERWTAVSG